MLVGNYNAKYKGKTMCGFIAGHKYNIDVDKDIYGYTLSGLVDLETNESSAACINYASENSIRRNWEIE